MKIKHGELSLTAIINAAVGYEIITFDVFDTLLIRDVMKPTDVFSLSYGKGGRYLRSLAEIVAKKRSLTGEASLSEINRYCPYSCERERQLEKKLCRVNPDLYPVYEALKKAGKKLYAISDMYLSSEDISELLRKAGYDIPVMVSCEMGCNKKSGELFRKFLNRYGYQPEQVLHIGDDPAGDGRGAEKAGIRSLLIPRHSDRLAYMRTYTRNLEPAAFINHGINRRNDPIEEPVERIGYEIVGPITLAFCQWVHEKKQEQGYERLYFLSRDMRFPYEVYRRIYHDDIRYIRISRKSLRGAREDDTEILRYLRQEQFYGKIAVVDTGWVGVAQVELDRYAKKLDPNSDVGGLYLGTKLAFRLRKRSKKSYACLYSSLPEQMECEISSSFLETLIGTNEEQVIAYKEGLPVYDRVESKDRTNLLKKGAKRFIREWLRTKGNKRIDPKAARGAFERLFYNPTDADMKLLGSLHYEDFKDTSIISYDPGTDYKRNIGKFLTDLGDSAWKGAYLKQFGGWYPFLLAGYYVFGGGRIFLADAIRCLKKEI